MDFYNKEHTNRGKYCNERAPAENFSRDIDKCKQLLHYHGRLAAQALQLAGAAKVVPCKKREKSQ